jgi:hypothetical protein
MSLDQPAIDALLSNPARFEPSIADLVVLPTTSADAACVQHLLVLECVHPDTPGSWLQAFQLPPGSYDLLEAHFIRP